MTKLGELNLINEINAMILLPDEPLEGDFIALDWDESDPSDFGCSWYCAQVLEVDGDRYKVSYNDQWYTFKEFGTPKPNKRGYNVYPALKPIEDT